MQNQTPTKELRALSASLIKTWETCSWLYYCKYVLKLPDESNDGAKRGTLCHKIFELLQNPRHRKNFDNIVDNNSVISDKGVNRLVRLLAKKSGIDDPENLQMVYDMILVGLKYDFFIKDAARVEEPEFKFDITDEQNRFRIKGFIDLLAFRSDETAFIRDYKSSKAKFSKQELNPNLQNFIYSWAVRRLFGVLSETEFLFLRFPKQPSQRPTPCSHADLDGIEEYFAYVTRQIQDFDEKKGKMNLASRSKATKWLCGSEVEGKWCCSFRKPFDYYAIVDKDGKVVKTSFQNDLTPKDGERVEKKYYSGCPQYN